MEMGDNDLPRVMGFLNVEIPHCLLAMSTSHFYNLIIFYEHFSTYLKYDAHNNYMGIL